MEQNVLRKDRLHMSDAIAQSVALLALVLGVALTTSFAAGSAGAAAPLAYVVASLASLCLAYVIIHFTRHLASAGGIYTYISQGLGPFAGFIGGWMYGGAFIIAYAYPLAIGSLFTSALLANIHLSVNWFVIYCLLLLILFLFAFFDIRISTRTQLALAIVGALTILLLVAIILVKGGDHGLSFAPFSPTALSGGISGLFFATIFGFTSFIGFEAAAVLGEETANPRQAIPRAILTAILVGMAFYVVVSYTFSVGYGINHADKWAMDQAPLDTLANRYAGPVLATFIDLMVVLGAFIASLAGLNLAVRMTYAMGRDRALPSFFGWTHPRYKSPWVGIVFGLLLALILGGTLGVAMGPLTYGGFLATAASLGILLAYILLAISGMIFFLRFSQSKRSRAALVFDVLFPAIAILLCGATVYSSLVPIPPAPLNYAPFVAGAWLVLGIILLCLLQLRNPSRVSQFGKMLGEGNPDASAVPS